MSEVDKKLISFKISPPVPGNIWQYPEYLSVYNGIDLKDINTIIKISIFTQLYFCSITPIIQLNTASG